MLNKFKIILEILAVFIAGVFVFFTWGLDEFKERSPSWKIYIDDVGGDRLKELRNKDKTLQICADLTNCVAVACQYSGTVKFTNHSKRPVEIITTDIELFYIEKKTNGRTDLSPYTMFKEACNPNKIGGECRNKADIKTTLNQIDQSPLFPNVEAWRPFSFFIYKGKDTGSFFRRNGLIIKATQKVKVSDRVLWWNKTTYESVAVYYDHLACGYGKEHRPLK